MTNPRDPNYVTFTRRTNDPKLAWLQIELNKAGIPNRRNGESFHAPILEVEEEGLDAAWKILNPIDELPDDDPQFEEVELTLKLQLDEWCELANAVESKSRIVERGDYGEANEEEGYDPKQWARDLEKLYEKIAALLDKVGIVH